MAVCQVYADVCRHVFPNAAILPTCSPFDMQNRSIAVPRTLSRKHMMMKGLLIPPSKRFSSFLVRHSIASSACRKPETSCAIREFSRQQPKRERNTVSNRREERLGLSPFAVGRQRRLLAASNGGSDDTTDTSKGAEAFYKQPLFYVQLTIAILTLGFVDAGYSGDWSRIGVLSQVQEEFLKTAAFFVVPGSAGLIWGISKKMNEKEG